MGNYYDCNAYKNGPKKNQPPIINNNQRVTTNPNELPPILKQKQEILPSSITSVSEPILNAAYIKYPKEIKDGQILSIKNCKTQPELAELLKELNEDLLEKLSKQDINITCFVKVFKLETSSSQKSDEELLSYFNETKDNLVKGFKNSIKEDKAKILDYENDFHKYKKNFEDDKAKVRNIIETLTNIF